ncbi:uncharacterized protein (DUF1015 family) [Prauserella sediminis]|uniref:Uncharacterized protein (DUF1015 family) n=1 Tax=Prauserella sediminis TaxID=577680 RepID=A0A839XNH4_9PSEU|nr:DUF1015 family protein [Prauserella sediminis]MBB3662378.1 uncharacterized protein (DUF1015 family) [Prauserella sediminis]
MTAPQPLPAHELTALHGDDWNAGVTTRPPRVLVLNPQRAAYLPEPATAGHLPGLLERGVLHHVPDPAVLVYRVTSGAHQQTGVVVEVAVDDYRTGRIRRHEATDHDRERQLAELTERCGVEKLPVTLAYPQRPALHELITRVAAGEPHVRVTREHEEHAVWIAQDAETVRAVYDELAALAVLYIADGHHRMAAAEHSAAPTGSFTLAALFPSDQLRILGYPRCVRLPADTPAPVLLDRLARQPVVARIQEIAPSDEIRPDHGTVSMYLDGRWYRLWLRRPSSATPPPTTVHPLSTVDTVLLDEAIIAPVLPAGEGGHTPLPGHVGTATIANWCDEHGAVGFLPSPPRFDQVMAVSDAGHVMPPKSTWFDPKVCHGLFLRPATGGR